MPVTTPNLISIMAQEVLQCVCDALNEQGSCECPCRAYVSLGPPAWDDCCNGQLVVYMERTYVINDFPAANTGEIQCTSALAADFVVQLIRCVPVVDDNGTPPSPIALNESAQNLYTDLYVAERAVICCLAAYKKRRRFAIRDTRPVGPQGGCGGFEIRFTIELVDPIPEII